MPGGGPKKEKKKKKKRENLVCPRISRLCALTWNLLSLCFVTEYDSDTSCHYKVELSYENFITSGPDPHPPPIADDESDDDDDDDIPQVRALQRSLSSL